MGDAKTGLVLRNAALLVRSRASGWGALAALGAGVLLLVIAPGLASITGYLFLAGVIVGVHWLNLGGATPLPVTLKIDERGLWADAVLLRERRDVVSARVIRRRTLPPLVHIRARGLRLPMRIAPANLDDARASLAALGVDRREGTRRFVLPGWRFSNGGMWITFVVSLVVAAFVVPLRGPHALSAEASAMAIFLIASAVAILARRLTRTTLTIARDGVLARTPLRSRFVPFGSMDRVQPVPVRKGYSRGFSVLLRSGEVLRFYTMLERMRGEGMYMGDHVMDAVQAGIKRSERHERDGAILERGTRSPRDWLNALRGAAGGVVGYRDAPISTKALLGILKNPGAGDEARAAAGAALAASSDPKARKRLRIAAEDIAAPRVRVALDAALTGDDDALVAALEQASKSRS